jgi:hypothetical protein
MQIDGLYRMIYMKRKLHLHVSAGVILGPELAEEYASKGPSNELFGHFVMYMILTLN